jgi:tetratricopeptide (TPR) repeat protein
MSGPSSEPDLLDRLAESFLARYRRGERPSLDEYAAGHPELADQIREFFPGLVVLEEAGAVRAPADAPLPPQLGEYRILRVVGRGGMGVVYEAVQESLGRHVALKVLPTAAALDPTHLERFRREARAAAQLHHTNIVPVFGVGEHDGVHYYAMQFIQGQGLDAVLQEVRKLRGRLGGGTAPGGTAAATAPVGGGTSTAAPGSSELITRSEGAYFRGVARVGLQVAEALEHAHRQGILHRDIKPSNLLLDPAGRVWVTDFGLARAEGAGELTHAGDVVGTLRYLAPERLDGVSEPRGDIYGLGVTLYELLTLRPAFPEGDRARLLERVRHEEPPGPRRLDPRVPRDLDVIVLKAMAKDLSGRYATAQELADDLRRFLMDEAIRARRPSLLQRARRWGRRHRALVGSAAAGLLAALAVLAGSAGWVARDRTLRREQARTEATAAREDIAQLRRQGRWTAALAVARRVETLLASGGGDRELRRQFAELGRDLQMAADLEEIRLHRSDMTDDHFESKRADAEYSAAFRGYGIDVETLEPAEAAERQRARAIPEELAAALDDWAAIRQGVDDAGARRLRAVARAADRDPYRNRLREAVEHRQRDVLEESAVSDEVEGLPPATVILLAGALLRAGAEEKALTVLRRAQRTHPDDLWINYGMGQMLRRAHPPRAEEAVRFSTAALALRPQSPGMHYSLGLALATAGKLPEAVDEYRRAIHLHPRLALAHQQLGVALAQLERPAEAAEADRRAIELRPEDAQAHYNLGLALAKLGKPVEAEDEYRRAIQHRSAYPMAHLSLGNVLRAQGKLPEAVEAYRRAVRIQPDYADAYTNLGVVLSELGHRPESVDAYRRVTELRPESAPAHFSLGNALRFQDRLPEAVQAYRRAIELQPDLADAHYNLGIVLDKLEDPPGAMAAYRRAIEAKPDHAQAHYCLGFALHKLGNLPEAVTEYRRAIELRPDYALALFNLGRALLRQGNFADALAALRRGHELGSRQPKWPYPSSAQSVRQAERLVELDAKLPKVLREEIRPADAAETAALAQLCQKYKKRFAAAARFYAEAFAAQPRLAEEASRRSDAAGAAALAGCGRGEDAAGLDEKQRASWRRQALAWLREDLEAQRRLLKTEPAKARPVLVRRLRDWLADADFAGVRGAEALARLPDAEQEGWRNLWRDVEKALAEAQGGESTPPSGPGGRP